MRSSGVAHAARFYRGGCALLLCANSICFTPYAGAEGLKNLISDLYGPGGFSLEPFQDHEHHFSLSSHQELDALNNGIASAVAILSPSVSIGGFTFDVERGIPMQTSQVLGPLLAERAETIGKGRFNVAAAYSQVHYTTFEGQPLTDLGLDFRHEPEPNNPPYTKDLIHVNLNTTINQEILALFGTYGLTDRWDIAVVVPLEHIFMDVTADASIVRNGGQQSLIVHNFGPNSSPQHLRVTDSASGIGDVLLRTKYNFLRSDGKAPDLAVVGQVRLPTGDENELLGSGNTAATLVLVASKPFGSITTHLNVGYEVNSGGDTSFNALRYAVGFDAVINPRLAAAAEIIGYWRPEGNGFGGSVVDFAVGFKWNLVRNFVVSANVQVPLNKNEGLRADYIWTIGAEYNF